MVALMKEAEPFSFAGSDIGVLVIHGFTGTTQSMRHLGTELHKRFGFTIEGPRLPGHGTSPDDMETTTYLDWLGHVEDALSNLADRSRKVFVTGLSMGGTLTLNLAARFPDKISAIAPIAGAVGPLSEAFAAVLTDRHAPKRIPGIGSDIKAPGVQEVAYGEMPVSCMRDVAVLITATRDLLHKVTCPTLVIHGREDHVVPSINARHVVSSISSDDIRLLWLNESYHVATLDNDKDTIATRVGEFFREFST